MKTKTIKWTDSCVYGGWMDKDRDFTPSECTTIGYVMEETDTYIVLAQSLDKKGDPGNVTVIPKIAIHD